MACNELNSMTQPKQQSVASAECELWKTIQTSQPCPLTGDRSAVVVANRDRRGQPLRTVISRSSGFVFVDPRPTTEELADFYLRHYRTAYKSSSLPSWKHSARAANVANLRMAMIRRTVSPGARILDIGSGSGELLYIGEQLGYQMEGIEIDPSYAEFGRRTYGVDLRTQSWEDLNKPSGTFDVVTIFHVLEHLENPVWVIEKLAKLLRPNGRLIVEVPNVESTATSYAQKWHFGHLFHFNVPTMNALGSRCGLREEHTATGSENGLVSVVFQRDHSNSSESQTPDFRGNFDQTLDFLRKQSSRSVTHDWAARIARAQAKLVRNVKELATGLTTRSRKQLVDQLSRKVA